MRETCRFCAKPALRSIEEEARLWDCVVFQSSNFVALPTLGAIVEGWVLLVPKNHYLCMGALGSDLLLELAAFRRFVARALENCYGSVAAFEHGPARIGQAVGCGVDHAHLHMLPTMCNLIDGAQKIFPQGLDWRPAKGIQDVAAYYGAGLSYLYVEQPMGEAYVATHPNIQSQLFRRVIATSTGRPQRYDWRSYREEQNVLSTVRTLEEWVSGNGPT